MSAVGIFSTTQPPIFPTEVLRCVVAYCAAVLAGQNDKSQFESTLA